MRIRVEIKTPKGMATSTEKKLRFYILGKIKKPADTYVNDEDDTFYWEVDVSIRQAINIQKNVSRFHTRASSVIDNKLFKRAVDKEEDLETLREMFKNTEVRIIKQATADEIVEANKTFWQRIKDTFKKHEVER